MKSLLVFPFLLLLSHPMLCQRSIDTVQIFTIGGIRQVVTMKGDDQSNPLLLFLHGGPGSSAMGYGIKFTYRLQKHFTVVQWDQRETGKTRAANVSPVPLTLALFENDTKELIDTLLKNFRQEKIYIMGHSWGTVLGFHIARAYPELVHAYIPVCPMINQLESERMALSLMKKKALGNNRSKAFSELSRVNIPFENGEQLFYHRKWLLDYNGLKKDFQKAYVENWADTWLTLFNEAAKNDLNETTPELRCPVYFMVGRKDLQTNSALTSAYYKNLSAPKKSIFWFENSGHFIPTTEPYRLQKIVIETILPETFLAPANKMVQTTD